MVALDQAREALGNIRVLGRVALLPGRKALAALLAVTLWAGGTETGALASEEPSVIANSDVARHHVEVACVRVLKLALAAAADTGVGHVGGFLR